MRTFWKVMLYACDRCGYRREFLLEDGCEGPNAVERTPDQLDKLKAVYVAEHIRMTATEWASIPHTSSGRMVLPVPFVAGGCPRCQPDGPPWEMRGGVLEHIDWNKDRKVFLQFETDEQIPQSFFAYPDDPTEFQACGVPSINKESVR